MIPAVIALWLSAPTDPVPMPRPVAPRINTPAFTTDGPPNAAGVYVVVKDGRVEVRWKAAGGDFVATAGRVTVGGDRVRLVGSDADPVRLERCGVGGADKQVGREIEVSLSAGTYRVIGGFGGTVAPRR